jgi:hypothetical protein
MEFVADILLVSGAFGAALYCAVLARRLSRFNDLESGVGGAVAVLSAQVDDLTGMLEAAKGSATGSAQSLEDLTRRAEDVASRLELMVASLHDVPDASCTAPVTPPGTSEAGASQIPVFSRNRLFFKEAPSCESM